jgi:hypothetical protein
MLLQFTQSLHKLWIQISGSSCPSSKMDEHGTKGKLLMAWKCLLEEDQGVSIHRHTQTHWYLYINSAWERINAICILVMITKRRYNYTLYFKFLFISYLRKVSDLKSFKNRKKNHRSPYSRLLFVTFILPSFSLLFYYQINLNKMYP